MQTRACEKLVSAAIESVEAIDCCYTPLAAMALPNDQRSGVAIALLYASLEQARSACYLVAHDVERSVFAAMILLRSQIDQLMRAAFFSGPAGPEQLAEFLKNDKMPLHHGQKLGPKLLATINADYFRWNPPGRVRALIDNSWDALCGMTHGGNALLGYYIHEDGIGPYPPTDEFIEVLSNAVALTHLGITIVMPMAKNSEAPDLQAELLSWKKAADVYFARWAPKAA